MTDRIHSINVVLEKDIRVDDAERILEAICMIKGVLTAEGNISDFETHMATARAKSELGQKLFEALKDG